MKLLLFDIDGTILRTKGGRQAMEQVLTRLCGRPIHTDHLSFGGKTDPQIVQEILHGNGFTTEETASLQHEVLATYLETARALIAPRHVEVFPGVRTLIEHLATHTDIQLALLTGNHEITAYLKLEAVGLATYFPFGAFGSDHADRNALPAIAVQRAYAHTGHTYTGHDIVIIGDTENDVRCGQGIGAFSVAVCTGSTSRETLAAEAPNVLLDDLRDQEAFVQRVVYRRG